MGFIHQRDTGHRKSDEMHRNPKTFVFPASLCPCGESTIRPLQQIRSWPLLSPNRTAKLGDSETSLDRFQERLPRCHSPATCQTAISVFDCSNVPWNLNYNSLP